MIKWVVVFSVLCFAAKASGQTPSVYLEDLTWPELRDGIAAGMTSAVIVSGGIEQNGPHMALIKHNLIARYTAGEIARRLGGTLVYPVVPFSMAGDPITKSGHMRLPGTISFSSEVYVGVMRQIALSAIAAGFKNVFLMGEHGQGQSEMKLAAESLDAEWRNKGARIFFVSDFNTKANQLIDAYLKEQKLRPGGHAAVGETAQVMFLDEAQKWIRRDKMALSQAGPTADTGVNDPSGATPALGKILMDFKIDSAVEQMRQLLQSAATRPSR